MMSNQEYMDKNGFLPDDPTFFQNLPKEVLVNNPFFIQAKMNRSMIELIVNQMKNGNFSNFRCEDEILIHVSGIGDLELVKFCVENGTKIDSQCLCNASSAGHLNVVKYLVSQGVDIHVNTYDGPPILLALQNNHFDVVTYLLKFGAILDLNSNTGECDSYNQYLKN